MNNNMNIAFDLEVCIITSFLLEPFLLVRARSKAMTTRLAQNAYIEWPWIQCITQSTHAAPVRPILATDVRSSVP